MFYGRERNYCHTFSLIGDRAVVIEDGIEVGVEIGVIRHWSPKIAYDLVKIIGLIKGILVEKFRTFPFSFDSAYESLVSKALNA